MPIPFQAPDWLIKEYLDRKSPAQEAGAGVSSALQTYIQARALEQQRQNEALGTYVKAFEAGGPVFATDVAKRTGLKNPPVLPGTTPATTAPGNMAGVVPSANPSPVVVPPTTESSLQQTPVPGPEQFMTPAPSPMGTHIVDHWNQMTAGQQGVPAPTAPPTATPTVTPAPSQTQGGVPGLGNPEDLLNMGTYGTKRLAAGEALGKYRQTTEANAPASFDEVRTTFGAANKPDIADQLIKQAQAAGQTSVQRKSVDAAIKGLGVANTGIRGSAIDSMAETRKQQLHLKTAEDYEKGVNPATASGGSLVSIAGKANARADRALQVLRNEKMTYQDLSTVISDISGIFQGGVPHEQALREQKYGTALERLASIKTYLSGQPAEGMVDPALRQKLQQVIKDVKRVDNKVIEDNMASKRNVFKNTSWAKENPGVIDDIENNIRSQYISAGEEEGDQVPTITSKQQYDALPSGASYLSADGKPHRKK